MIKCSECGRDISDKASSCVGCGAPVGLAVAKAFGNLYDDGNVGMSDVKSMFSALKKKVVDVAEVAVEQGKKFVKSKQQKDDESLNEMVRGFGDAETALQSASELNCAKFKAALESTINVKFAEIMKGKADTDRFLTYIDGQILTGSVRNVFKSALGVTPVQIEAACGLSEAILAPSSDERERLIKTAVGVGGGATGIAMIIAGVGSALGWGAGVIASVSAFFVGTSMAGPIGWGVAGVALAGTAAYFATTSNKHTDTDRFLNVLKSATCRALDAIWSQHEEALVRALNIESAA